MKPSRNIWLACSLLVAVALGFSAGRITSDGDSENEAANDADSSAPSNARSSSRVDSNHSSRGRGQRADGSRDIGRTMKSLIAQLERSPMSTMDFDGMFEIWETLRGFSEAEIVQALGSAGDIKNAQLRMMMEMMVMSRWGKLNGKAAMDHAVALENNQSKMMGVMGVLMSWTKEDPEAAFTWYENNQKELSQGGMGARYYDNQIYEALAKHDLTRALNYVDNLETQAQKKNALTAMAGGVVDDPAKLKKLLAYIVTNSGEKTKTEVMQSVISSMSMHDPEGARAYIQTVDDPEQKQALTKSMVASWAHMDAEAAITWGMEHTTDAKGRKEILSSNLSSWAAQNSSSATKWYDKQPAEYKSDDAVSQTASTLSYMGQHENAFKWADRLDDPKRIEASKKSIYQQWLEKSPTDARAWAEGKGKATMEGIDLSAVENDSSSAQ